MKKIAVDVPASDDNEKTEKLVILCKTDRQASHVLASYKSVSESNAVVVNVPLSLMEYDVAVEYGYWSKTMCPA